MTPQDAMYNYFVMGFQMGMFEEPYIQRGVKLGWINQSQANALEMQFFPQHADMTTSQGSASVTMPTSESTSASQPASQSASQSVKASESASASKSESAVDSAKESESASASVSAPASVSQSASTSTKDSESIKK